MEPIPNFYTYTEGRECLKCGKAIADQIHATTIFCPREKLDDGRIKNCKDNYHSAATKEKNFPFKKIFNYHKEAQQRIQKLFEEKGETVTTEQITQYGIRLDMPVKFDGDAQKYTLFFIGFCFKQISKSQFKLTRHEHTF